MKKNILFLILLTTSLLANAQLIEKETADWQTIGQLKFGGITKAKVQYTASGSDTTYFLFIKDVRDQPKDHYFSITFKNLDGTFEKFYDILKSFFLEENKKNRNYSRTFKLGDKGVNIQYHLLITGRGIRFTTSDGYTYWSEKDIDKLFGKD
jgi:hypothetical protein